MKKIITLGAILAACTFAVPAMAQRGDDRVDARQDRQQHRIEQGYRSGDLTRREARQLSDGQKRIDRMQHQARRDGRVTEHERRRIHKWPVRIVASTRNVTMATAGAAPATAATTDMTGAITMAAIAGATTGMSMRPACAGCTWIRCRAFRWC